MEKQKIKLSLFDNKLTVWIPNTYHEMEQNKIKQIYPYDKKPQIILEDTTISRFCTFSLLENQVLLEKHIESAINSIEKVVASLRPTSIIKKSELLKVENRLCGWFSFETFGEEKICNFVYIFSVSGLMMLGTTGCYKKDEIGRGEFLEMINTIEIEKRRN